MKVPQLHVGAGSRLGPLGIFPVWTSGSGSLGISTGTHADVAVTELASGAQVARLTVTNNGPHPALLLEGELLEGGQQDRTCARDVVLGPGETRDIDTFCVEAGRWEAGQSSHRRQARRAPLNVWSELANGPGERGGNRQGRIWERVSRFDNVRGASATSSLLQHMDRFRDDKEERNRFSAADAPKPLEGQRGVVIGLGQQPLLLEVFGTNTLFRRHYRQLIDSALLDLELLPPQALASGPMPGQRARDFAAHVQALDFGTFDDGAAAVEVRNHGTLRSRNVSRAAGSVSAAGIAVELPTRRPQLAHLTGWNTQHPLMEMA
ncbi:ARPP-1 family domain-containing protein [Arthrobacter sp. LAR12-1-1.1]|uniref:ARPP-1 family domain-containing protein n=1 Tax=Arthrobacter sp. LAR12-1-1.1 TaxID=3135215 RepID=UPI0034402B55